MPNLDRSPLIVGSGIAGLYVALRCREAGLRPTLVTKATLEESNTRYAQGGIAAALGNDDRVELHWKDTLRAGDGLVDREAARCLAEEAPARIANLVRYGVPFDTEEGRIALGREAAHSRSRILHAGGDATGLQIEETLKRRAIEAGVEARERTRLRALRPSEHGIEAILSREVGGNVEVLDPRPVVLATGGAGSLYRQSSNPSIATGEGVAIAYRAGLLLTDMEFIQFHPTTFFRKGAPRFLITEALRGEGAVLRNRKGERFLTRYDPAAELAPRDVVSRAIHDELTGSDEPCAFLDATSLARDKLYARFPTVCRFLAPYNLDPAIDLIPVAPAAHYMIGGVTTDLEGRTTCPDLYACGEVASTGVHGANRLASNSLLEGLVFGERISRQLRKSTRGGPVVPRRRLSVLWTNSGDESLEGVAEELVRDTLWESVGIVRREPELSRAVRVLEQLANREEREPSDGYPTVGSNAAVTALLIARAARERIESRGAHYRSDYPQHDPRWKHHLGLRREPGQFSEEVVQ